MTDQRARLAILLKETQVTSMPSMEYLYLDVAVCVTGHATIFVTSSTCRFSKRNNRKQSLFPNALKLKEKENNLILLLTVSWLENVGGLDGSYFASRGTLQQGLH